MKKFLASVMAFAFIALNAVPALAVAQIADVADSYWAKKEIDIVVSNDIMNLDEKGNFNPDANVSRICFVKSLLKLLSNDNLNVNISNQFS